jgi:hypothetical protein
MNLKSLPVAFSRAAFVLVWLPAVALAQDFDQFQPLAEIGSESGFAIDGSVTNMQIGKGGTAQGDFNGDGIDDLAIGVPQAAVLQNGASLAVAGEVFVIFGTPQGIAPGFDLESLRSVNGGDGSRGFVIQGERLFDRAGTDLATIGDINGDGRDDLLVGAPGRTSFFLEGISYIVFGRSATQSWPAELDLRTLQPTGPENINTGLGIVIQCVRRAGECGRSVKGLGDVTNDGFDDFMIGNTLQPGTGVGNGSPGFNYLIYGRGADNPWPARFNLIDLHIQVSDGSQGVVIRSNKSDDGLGLAVAAAADFTGDGIVDILLGAPNSSEEVDTGGMGLIVPGRATGADTGFGVEFDLRLLDDKETVHFLTGSIVDDGVGDAVAGIGDINGDGRPDIAIGGQFSAMGGDDSGVVYVLYGRPANSPLPERFSLGRLLDGNGGDGSQGFVIVGNPGDRLGASIAKVGDLNSDGTPDLLIGAPGMQVDGGSAGGAYVMYGRSSNRPFPAALTANALTNANNGFVFTGESNFDLAGRSVASAGDFNSDGSIDMAIAAELSDARFDNAGRIYVIYGNGDDVKSGANGRLTQSWYDPERGGEGVLTEFGVFNGQPSLFAAWYTYLDGRQQWMSTNLQGFTPGATQIEATLFTTTGADFGASFDTNEVTTTRWGTVQIDLPACDQMLWRYESDDASQVGELSLIPALADLLGLPGCRQTETAAAKVLQFGNGLGAEMGGTWWNPARSGEGILLDIEVRGGRPTAFFSWFTYAGGVQQWLVGSVALEDLSNDLTDIPLVVTIGGQFGPGFDPTQVESIDWGLATMSFSSCNDAELQYNGQFPDGEPVTGSISLVRFTEGLQDFQCAD